MISSQGFDSETKFPTLLFASLSENRSSSLLREENAEILTGNDNTSLPGPSQELRDAETRVQYEEEQSTDPCLNLNQMSVDECRSPTVDADIVGNRSVHEGNMLDSEEDASDFDSFTSSEGDPSSNGYGNVSPSAYRLPANVWNLLSVHTYERHFVSRVSSRVLGGGELGHEEDSGTNFPNVVESSLPPSTSLLSKIAAKSKERGIRAVHKASKIGRNTQTVLKALARDVVSKKSRSPSNKSGAWRGFFRGHEKSSDSQNGTQVPSTSTGIDANGATNPDSILAGDNLGENVFNGPGEDDLDEGSSISSTWTLEDDVSSDQTIWDNGRIVFEAPIAAIRERMPVADIRQVIAEIMEMAEIAPAVPVAPAAPVVPAAPVPSEEPEENLISMENAQVQYGTVDYRECEMEPINFAAVVFNDGEIALAPAPAPVPVPAPTPVQEMRTRSQIMQEIYLAAPRVCTHWPGSRRHAVPESAGASSPDLSDDEVLYYGPPHNFTDSPVGSPGLCGFHSFPELPDNDCLNCRLSRPEAEFAPHNDAMSFDSGSEYTPVVWPLMDFTQSRTLVHIFSKEGSSEDVTGKPLKKAKVNKKSGRSIAKVSSDVSSADHSVNERIEAWARDLPEYPGEDRIMEQSMTVPEPISNGVVEEGSSKSHHANQVSEYHEDTEELEKECRDNLFDKDVWEATRSMLSRVEDDTGFSKLTEAHESESPYDWTESDSQKLGGETNDAGLRNPVNMVSVFGKCVPELPGLKDLDMAQADDDSDETINTHREAHLLVSVVDSYRQIFAHAIKASVLPCGDKVRKLVREILLVKTLEGELALEVGHINRELATIRLLLEVGCEAQGVYLQARIRKCRSSLGSAEVKFRKIHDRLCSLEHGYLSSISGLVDSITNIGRMRARILAKYDNFHALSVSESDTASEGVRQWTHMEEYQKMTAWYTELDVENFQMLLNTDLDILTASSNTISRMVQSVHNNLDVMERELELTQ